MDLQEPPFEESPDHYVQGNRMVKWANRGDTGICVQLMKNIVKDGRGLVFSSVLYVYISRQVDVNEHITL